MWTDRASSALCTGKGIYDYGGRSEAEILIKRDKLYLAMQDHLSRTRAFEPV